MIKIKDDIYFVGALNPNLRVFDIIMRTDYGTTYNAYLIRGEKTALIETVHDSYKGVMLDNIKEICEPSEIDYIVMNHTEPDHSGSIAEIVALNPNVTVVASPAGIKNIGAIANTAFKSRTVKTGDKLDLGKGLELEFIISPNLHWPDSMFTYLASRKTAFTCDFLGSHYCEPLILDKNITHEKAYESAFRYYYNAIFGPFKKFVLDGLDRLEKLDFDTACVSHGPVLQSRLDAARKLYREWSQPHASVKSTAIFYVSAYGYTKSLAEAFEKELNALGVSAKAYNVIETEQAELAAAIENSSSYMFGSPTINRDALKPVWDIISSIDAVNNKGKQCFVFGSYGWSGEACAALDARLRSFGMKLEQEPLKVVFKPDEGDFKKVKEISEAFAEKA